MTVAARRLVALDGRQELGKFGEWEKIVIHDRVLGRGNGELPF